MRCARMRSAKRKELEAARNKGLQQISDSLDDVVSDIAEEARPDADHQQVAGRDGGAGLGYYGGGPEGPGREVAESQHLIEAGRS